MARSRNTTRFRFGLRTVLLLFVVAGLALAYVSSAREQIEAVRTMQASNPGVALLYDYQVDAGGHLQEEQPPPGPAWLRSRVGVDYLSKIAGADMFYPTDGDMECLARFPNLRRLVLERSIDLTDRGIARIADLASLEYLVIGEADQVSDEGLLELVRLQNLKELRLRPGRRMTTAGIAELGERMPGCRIVVRQYDELATRGTHAGANGSPTTLAQTSRP